MVKEIVSAEEFDSLVVGDGVLVAYFWAAWCGPCRQYSPIFQEVSEKESLSSVSFVKLNVDQLADVSAAYGVSSIPTTIIFRDGELGLTIVGPVLPHVLEEEISKLI